MLRARATRRVTGSILVVLNCILNIGGKGEGGRRGANTELCQLSTSRRIPPLTKAPVVVGKLKVASSPTIQPSLPNHPTISSLFKLPNSPNSFPWEPPPPVWSFPNATQFHPLPLLSYSNALLGGCDIIRDYILTLRWTLVFDNIALKLTL